MKNNDYAAIDRQLIRRRRKMYRKFSKFRSYYLRHHHEVPDAPFHLALVEKLEEISRKRSSKIALAAPRGSAKSTIIALEYLIYSICYHTEDFIVIVSNTAEHAAEALQNLKRELEGNDLLRHDFPEVCELGKKPQPIRWSQKEIITKNNIKVIALGIGQNIRGKRHGQYRPSLVILDDLEGNDAVQNEDSRFKLKDWFEKSVLKVGHNRTNFIFTGTIHHYGSLLAQYTNPKQVPGWDSSIHRSVIKWSEAITEWELWTNIYCQNQEYEGNSGPEAALAYFKANQDKMLAGTEVLWPQRASYYELMVTREREGRLSFDSELQNEPVNPRDCFFNIDELHFWDDKYADGAQLIKSIPYPLIYAACDPSMGKDKSRGDFSAIITGVWDSTAKTLYVLDVDIARRQPENLIETLLDYRRLRDFRMLGVESNNFQELVIRALEQRAAERGISCPIKGIDNRKDKISRIQALQPYIKSGKLQFHHKQRALLEQLKYFPKGQHDDGPDALEMLFQLASQQGDWSAWV